MMMLVDAEGERIVGVFEQDPRDERQIALHRTNDPEFTEAGTVSCLHKCQSEEAKKLCIFDLSLKLKHSNEYDIGGTYTGNEPDLWFYFTISKCPGTSCLVNLFVCHRKDGDFSIGVSSGNEVINSNTTVALSEWSILPRSLTWFPFKSVQPNEIHYIKTFCFDQIDHRALTILYIPITIRMNTGHSLNNDVLMSIKLQHDLSELLSKQELTDYVLVSASGKKYPVHKTIIGVHSPVLKDLIKDSDTNSLNIDIQDSDMELLLQFLYTGSFKNIIKHDCMHLLKIADKFQIENLFLIAQYSISEQINVESAVDIAVLSQKYKLAELQSKVFSFIKNNPKVMSTDSWKKLSDVELTKQMIEHIYSGSEY